MNKAELVKEFPTWHYEFDLGNGIKTPILKKAWVNRHKQRKTHIFDRVVKEFGGNLDGARVLDLGCNAGYWSLAAIEAGASFVCGIDARQYHIDQANFVFRHKEIPSNKYHFVCGDAVTFSPWYISTIPTFDIVLCMGLLYHVNQPVELFKNIAKLNNDLLLIDTRISLAPYVSFHVHFESTKVLRNSASDTLVLIPTEPAITMLASHYGYSVISIGLPFTNFEGAESYKSGGRKAYIARKRKET